MKTKQELLKMLYTNLYELEEMKDIYNQNNKKLLLVLQAQTSLLYDILGEEVD